MIFDNLHYCINGIFGYQKPFNAIISCREAGKTTSAWSFIFNRFVKFGETTILIRRRIADITEAYIEDIFKIFIKFGLGTREDFSYRNTIKQGVVDIKYQGKDFFRIIALSNPIGRIKSMMYNNLEWILFDEFIINTRANEKYLRDEAFIFKEIYNTFQRESKHLRCIFLGNPYSLYNPYFTWWNVPTNKLKPDTIIQGDAYVVECYEIKQELREYILAKNPLYQFDDGYKEYGFNGIAVNDMNIRLLEKVPDNYKLKHVFRIDNKFLGIYENNNMKERIRSNDWYWCGIIDYSGEKRKIYCFDFEQLINGTALMSRIDKQSFATLKYCIQNRRIEYEKVECSYLMEEIYKNI